MNGKKQLNDIQQSGQSSGLSSLFSFAMLLVFILAQNADWGNNQLLWWGSIGLYIVSYFLCHGSSFRIERNYAFWIVSFFGICTISVVWAVNTALVVTVIKGLVIHIIVLLLLMSSIKSESNIERILNMLMVSVVINSVWLLLTSSMFENANSQVEAIDRLGTEGTWNANSVGMMAAVAMLIALYFQKQQKSLFKKNLYIGVIALTILVALLSGSRKAILMVLMGMCGFILVSSKGKRVRSILLVIGVVLVLFYITMKSPLFYSTIGWRMEGFFALLTGVGEVDSSAQLRDEYIKDAIRAWREKPLLGHGLNCYRTVNKVKLGMYAHNNYVELLADLGIVGTAIYYSAYAYCLTRLLKVKQKSSMIWLFLVFGCIFLVMDYGHVSYNSFLNEILLMLMYSIISIRKKRKCHNPIFQCPQDNKIRM